MAVGTAGGDGLTASLVPEHSAGAALSPSVAPSRQSHDRSHPVERVSGKVHGAAGRGASASSRNTESNRRRPATRSAPTPSAPAASGRASDPARVVVAVAVVAAGRTNPANPSCFPSSPEPIDSVHSSRASIATPPSRVISRGSAGSKCPGRPEVSARL